VSPLRFLVLLATTTLHRRTTGVRRRLHGEAGEIVTWVILAAGLALIAVAVVVAVGAKLRAKANGIQLQ